MWKSENSTTTASGSREVAYPVEQVWLAMATLLPYCPVCDVSAILDGPGEQHIGTTFRAFPGRVDERPDEISAVEGGTPGEIVHWSLHEVVATRLEAGNETVVVQVEMAAASPDTTLVTISVGVTPQGQSRLAKAMARTSYARLARRTVEGEIEKLPAHLALLEAAVEPDS